MLTVLLLNWGSRNRDIVESDKIPTFPVAKRPRTGTPLPASPPPSHRHFAPSVASSPAILKLPVPLVPTNLSPPRVPANISPPPVSTNVSPPRGITESTITLAPIIALPPRTTGNIQPAITTNAMTSAPKHPAKAPAHQQQVHTTTSKTQKPPAWMLPAKNHTSSPTVEQKPTVNKGKKTRFQNGTTSNFNSYTNIGSYVPPPPPSVPLRRSKVRSLMSSIVKMPLMDLALGWGRPDQQTRQEQDRHPAAVPQPATTSGSANTTTAHNSKPQANQTIRATKQHPTKCRPATHESKQTRHHVTAAPTAEHGNM
ncbi:unnamed protein product [Didymodactylos carnosus]|uniref:Uncharacterized protein n=1 Tax=Didymodactylos carnosus TaxID=1234261 RepID=A0A816BP40_9BILA|nr:unnamed protein product [Didymodactylos carnosus]CAF4497461.1 unnamed protein product [Didymodactylos carnosus]